MKFKRLYLINLLYTAIDSDYFISLAVNYMIVIIISFHSIKSNNLSRLF